MGLLRRARSSATRFLKTKRRLAHLRRNDFAVTFPLDGDVRVQLPKLPTGYFRSARQRSMLWDVWQFQERPTKEALLRKLVFQLLQNGGLDPKRSIVDIGCWLGDNAIVWAMRLGEHGGRVIAIDPSRRNLDFVGKLARLNQCDNLELVEAVCADRTGREVAFDGHITHAAFRDKQAGDGSVHLTTTLDEIVGTARHGDISLLHVDVEGFEEQVIRGAEAILAASRPVVIFEQHISSENHLPLTVYLQGHGYAVFMINEVLPACRLDCRNFMAIHATAALELPEVVNHAGVTEQIWYAVPGPALIPVG